MVLAASLCVPVLHGQNARSQAKTTPNIRRSIIMAGASNWRRPNDKDDEPRGPPERLWREPVRGKPIRFVNSGPGNRGSHHRGAPSRRSAVAIALAVEHPPHRRPPRYGHITKMSELDGMSPSQILVLLVQQAWTYSKDPETGDMIGFNQMFHR